MERIVKINISFNSDYLEKGWKIKSNLLKQDKNGYLILLIEKINRKEKIEKLNDLNDI